jgi:DNA-directed RNA polymerase specialized sigma24 family protein
MIRCLVDGGFSKNAIARLLGGSKSTAYSRMRRALGED